MKKYRSIIIKSIIIVLLVATLIVLIVLKNNPDIAEAFMRGPARVYALVASKVSSAIPFISLTELLFISLGAVAILFIVLFILDLVKKQVVKGIGKVLNIALIAVAVITAYQFSCEAAYNRKEMPLPYYQNDVERTEYASIYNFFASDLGECLAATEFTEKGNVKNAMSFNNMVKEVKKAYQIVNDPYFHSSTGSVKKLLSSFIYREFQLTGVTFSPLGEANINTLNVTVDIPYTIAHEIAHTKGVMREDDANILAFYVCLNSDNPFLRLSAYNRRFNLIANMGSGTYLTKEEIAGLVKPDLSNYYKSNSFQYNYWNKEHNLLKNVGDFFNNLSLKSSGVSEGTSSYSNNTEEVYDPTEHRLSYYNLYHKLFFEKYYRCI